jgi:peptidoglycan lytic transglycosylase
MAGEMLGGLMSGTWRRIAAVSGLALIAAACASTGGTVAIPSRAGVYKIGDPYQVEGTWYYPHEQPAYDETGIASWYGADFHGRLTADGEIFDRNALTAAHPTLPLPVNVRVTNLENGRSLVVRVNDRGPFAGGRLIDLSERAADLLGFKGKGLAPVRVTYLDRADGKGGSVIAPPAQTPPDVATAVASAPTARIEEASLIPVPDIATAPATPVESLPSPAYQPPPAAKTQQEVPDGKVTLIPVPPTTSIFVQAGAFTSLENAKRVLATLKRLGAGISPIMKDGRPLYRVRLGPFNDVSQADAALARVHVLGDNDARIVVD